MSGMCGDIEEDRAVLRSYPRTAPEAELGTQFDRLVDDRMRAEPRRCQLTTLTEVVATHGLDRIDLLKIDVERPRPMCSPESTRAPGKESTRSSLRCPTWTAGCGPYWTNWRGAASGVSSGSGRGAVGLSLFVVDSDSPGIAIERIEPVGWRAADPATVRFESVRVPVDHVVGRQGSGFYQLERVVAAALALGGADRNLQLTREHLVHRRAFGARLADLPAVRHRVADLATGPRRRPGARLSRCLAVPVRRPRIGAGMFHGQALRNRARYPDSRYEPAVARRTWLSRRHRGRQSLPRFAAGPSEVMRDIITRLEIDEATDSTIPSTR